MSLLQTAGFVAGRIRGTLVARPQQGSPGCQELQAMGPAVGANWPRSSNAVIPKNQQLPFGDDYHPFMIFMVILAT